MTLVSAPAGFGKTTLLGQWASRLSHPVAWLSLDEADNDPTRWLTYLVAALAQVAPTVGRDVPLVGLPPEAVMAYLVNDLAAVAHEVVLILDDFHLIDEPAIHAAVRELVAHPPPLLRLVIATREDPPLPLARLRARGELLEVRAQDLRFTADEAVAFLNDVMGLSLDADDVATLDRRIEGWPAGLQLAALSLRGRDDPAALIAGLSGSHHFILSYLTEEVLRSLPPDTQRFLLDTSVLDRVSSPLADAVTGGDDSAALLERLAAANAFVLPLDDAHAWYRYHPLFADLLRAQLHASDPARVPALHRRASAWYEAHGDASPAIEHAFAAEDYARVVRLLEAHARDVVLQGEARRVEDWLRRLPPAWQVAGPRANLAFAWSLLLRGQPGGIEPYLATAEAAEGAEAGVRAEALGLRAGLVSLQGDVGRAVDLARQAVDLAPADDVYAQAMTRFCLATALNYAGRTADAIDAYQAALPLCQAAHITIGAMLVVGNLALLYLQRGQIDEAAALCRSVMDAVEGLGAPPSPALATVYLNYADILFRRGDLDAAEGLAERWLDRGRRGGHVAAVAYGNVLLSRIRLARGDLAGAQAALDEVATVQGRRMPAWVGPEVVDQRVAVALARGDEAAATEVLARSGVALDDPTDHVREPIHLAYLRLLLHQGQRDAARRLAERLMASADAGGRLGRVRQVSRMVEGSRLKVEGSDPPSTFNLEPSTLTERELEVLRLIAAGLSYDEIAVRLVVSLNTVRYHIKAIYGKLGVNKRAAAVEAGRSLGLL